MMKRILALLLCALLPLTAANATILPPAGVDEGFCSWTGIECTPAVILCESLSVLDARGDQGGKVVETLRYSGTNTIPVIESWDGYARICYSDGNKTGWVRSEYLLMDPAWYLCDTDRQVYAYPDVMAPCVAWLEAGTMLPIITEYDDGESVNGWVCVSLRGAAGWIRKTAQDTAGETWFRPAMLAGITEASLTLNGLTCINNFPGDMLTLSTLLIHAEDQGGAMAGCPFGATLSLTLENGQVITIELATDSCCVYRVDGRDYVYARNLAEEDDSPDNSVLYEVFGIVDGELLPGNG